jgi:hypothetical protein
MAAAITVKSGDIVLGNWQTLLGRIATKGGQRWGHAAIVVTHEGQPHVYEISVASGKPVMTSLEDYLKDPTLKELAFRQLRQPLGIFEEEEFVEALLAHEHARYPPLGEVFARLTGGGAPEIGDGGKYLCSELVFAILRMMRWISDAEEQQDAPRSGAPLLPDQLAPGGGIPQLDSRYEPKMKVVVRREIGTVEGLRMLEPQLMHLGQYLA